MSLQGRRVLVTGASRGIGAACARRFAELGASCAVHYQRDQESATRVAQDVTSRGVAGVTVQADLSRWAEGARLVAEAEHRLGPLDVVVLNHGIWKETAIDAMSEGDYDETMDANLRGYFSVTSAAASRMKTHKSGSIVMVSSTAGQRGEALHSLYAATKGACISLVKSLAAELAPFGVRVNCVAPGWVRTDMTREALSNATIRTSVERAIPLGRVGSAEEIAACVAFLASDEASFVTGEIFNVNGGAVLVG